MERNLKWTGTFFYFCSTRLLKWGLSLLLESVFIRVMVPLHEYRFSVL